MTKCIRLGFPVPDLYGGPLALSIPMFSGEILADQTGPAQDGKAPWFSRLWEDAGREETRLRRRVFLESFFRSPTGSPLGKRVDLKWKTCVCPLPHPGRGNSGHHHPDGGTGFAH